MSVELDPEVEQLVQSLMRERGYRDASEVVREALRLLEARDKLREEIQLGIDQLDSGERIAGDTVFDDLRAHARQLGSGES